MAVIWSDRVAFVTGGAGGIGRGLAFACACRGMKVAVADIDDKRASATAAEINRTYPGKAIAIALDVRHEDQWAAAAQQVLDQLGPLSLLFNNAGVGSQGPLLDTSPESWKWVFDINCHSMHLGARAFIQQLRSVSGPRRIVNTGSIASLVGMAGLGAYPAAKFAAHGLSLQLREELRSEGIDVSLVLPGTIKTRLNEHTADIAKKTRGEAVTEPAENEDSEGSAACIAAGTHIFNEIDRGKFYIFTHPEWRDFIKLGWTKFWTVSARPPIHRTWMTWI